MTYTRTDDLKEKGRNSVDRGVYAYFFRKNNDV